MLSRRNLLLGLAAVAAPAIIRPGILMPVRGIYDPGHTHMVDGVSLFAAEHPIGLADPTHTHALTEDSLLSMMREVYRTGSGLKLRPTHLHT